MMHKKIYWYNMSNSYTAVPLMFLHTSYLKNLINILVHYKMHIKFILNFKEKSSMIVCVSVTIKAHKNIIVFIWQYFKPSFMLNDFLFSVINWFAETMIFMN